MRRLSAERGNASIIVAFMATALLGVAALAIDVGAMLVRQSQLQAGADAAAMAIARECAGFVVALAPANCNASQALSTASDYFADNLPGLTADVAQPAVTTVYDGIAGRVTVNADTTEPAMFAWALGDETLEVAANATARWGPLVAVDAVFPLAFCRGALPGEDQPVELWSSPSGGELLGECEGAPDALPMGWLTPTDSEDCTVDVTLMPLTWLDVAPSDQPPTSMGCTDAINDLLSDIERPRWQCGEHECRKRVVAVYDAARASGGRHPAYSLTVIQFSGARLGDDEAHRPWWREFEGVCDPDDDTYAMAEVQCVRGTVRRHNPPDDGPIVGLDDIDISGIDEATVLDVRLVD